MPGNEVGDRVHNFFAQDNLSQNQYHSQVGEVNWPVLNNHPWAGSHRQVSVQGSNQKNYDSQQSDLERGHSNHSVQVPHGNMYGGQILQERPDEANFLGVEPESDQNNLMMRGFSVYEPSQGSGPEHHPTTSVRLGSSEPVSFDFFGGQQQMNGQHPGMLRSLPQQQARFSDMQQFHQQVMIGNMQELQRQKELQQLEARQQNSVNQVPSFMRQASGNHSHALANGNMISAASNSHWATELTTGNPNWLQRASPAIQGSASGHLFSPEQGQASSSTGLVNQQVEQSLYGVPISCSRSSNQFPHIMTDKCLQQKANNSNSFQGNQCAVLPEQVSIQDVTSSSRQGFQGKSFFENSSGQALNSEFKMENLQLMNSLQRNSPVQEFQGRQELVGSSEIFKEKSAAQVSSQNSVGLDPTEEKILFGSDDGSIWDAFGKSTDMSEGVSSIADGAGFINGFPSIQSGTWSALMQSAVAETSSNDIDLQGEWTDFSFQSPGLHSGNSRPSTYIDTGKRHTALEDNSMHISPAFSFGYVPQSDEVQQSGKRKSQETGERLQGNFSQRPIHQSPLGGTGGSNWLNRGDQTYGNDSHPVNADANGKNISSYWTSQQSGSSKPSNKPNNRSADTSVTNSGNASFNIHENAPFKSQTNDQDRIVHDKLNQYDARWKVNSVPNSAVEMEHLRSTIRSPPASREGSGMNNAATLPHSRNTAAYEEMSKYLPNSHQLDWKFVETAVKSNGSDHSGKLQKPVMKDPQLVDLLSNSEGEVKMHEMDKHNKKENPNDSRRTNLPHLSDANASRSQAGGKQKLSNQLARKSSGSRKFQYHPMGNLDEDNELPYQTRQAMPLYNSQIFKSQDQRLVGLSRHPSQVPKISTDLGKGQLHDREGEHKGLDEVPSRGIPPGYVMSAPFDRSTASPSSENVLELLHEVDQSKDSSRGMHFSLSERNPEVAEAEISDGSGGHFQRSQSVSQGYGLQLAPPSQLLPFMNHISQSHSKTVNPSTSTQANCDKGDKGHIKLSSTTLSQSLPSSQEISQGEFKNNRPFIAEQTIRDASLQKLRGNFSSTFTSGSPYSRNQLQNQQIAGEIEPGSMSCSVDVPFNNHSLPPKEADDHSRRLAGQFGEASFQNAAGNVPFDNPTSSVNLSHPTATSYPREGAPVEKISAGEGMSVSQPYTNTGIFQQGAVPKMLQNLWNNAPAQQQLLGGQARQAQSKLSEPQQSDKVGSTLSSLQNMEDQNAKLRGLTPSDSQDFVYEEEQLTRKSPCQQDSSGNVDLFQRMNESQRKESRYLSDSSPSNPSSTQRDIEAFGRSLKPSNSFQHNYSLLNQIRAIKKVDTDPSNRGSKRQKGFNDILPDEKVSSKSEQPNESIGMVETEDALASRSSNPSGYPKLPSFSAPVDYVQKNFSSQFGTGPPQDVPANQHESPNYPIPSNIASVRIEHPKISPQMAPSWFKQYGTFKNGQMLQMYDAQKADTSKPVEQPFTLGKSSSSLHTLNSMEHVNPTVDTSLIGSNQRNSIPAPMTLTNYTLSKSLPLDNLCQKDVLRPKKRKSAAFEIQSWHKEVSQGSQNLQTISVAETEWAKAANRLREKVGDDAETIEPGLPIPRARRRLVLTTQLMQQLFRAPPAVVLSTNASSNYEAVTYFVTRIALGDACSLISCLKSYSDVPHDTVKIQADKCKSSNGNGNQHLSLIIEDFTRRAMKLESDFLRLDKRSSVSDLRVESRDLEKMSIINRFAKFHGRGQADATETSSFSDKPLPQNHVTAVPMPRNLPDRVHCLSL